MSATTASETAVPLSGTQADASGAGVGSGAARLDYIDGLRALACLMVILCHVCLNYPLSFGYRHVAELAGSNGLLLLGGSGVNLFLVISGFCLYWPFVKPRAKQEPTLKQYLLRRCWRILPPYYAACLLTVALALLFRDERGGYLARWLLVHLALLHTSIPGYVFRIGYAGPFWSIALEFQCYLLFPVLVEAYRRLPARWVLAALLLMTGAYRWYMARNLPSLGGVDGLQQTMILVYSLYGRCFEFALGMFCARLVSDWNRTGVSPLKIVDYAMLGLGTIYFAVTVMMYFGFFAGIRATVAQTPVQDSLYALFYAGIVLVASRPRLLLHRVAAHPWLVRLGVMSYSVYLLHTQVLYVVRKVFFYGMFRVLHISGPLPEITQFGLGYMVTIPVIIAVGYLFHLLVERHFLSGHAKREIAAELHRPAAPAPEAVTTAP